MRSFKDRTVAKLKVSCAEVGALEDHRRAILAVAAVSNEAAHLDEILAAAANIAGTLRDAVLVDRCTEIIPLGMEGRGMTPTESSDWMTT